MFIGCNDESLNDINVEYLLRSNIFLQLCYIYVIFRLQNLFYLVYLVIFRRSYYFAEEEYYVC